VVRLKKLVASAQQESGGSNGGPGVNSRRAALKSLLNCGWRCAMDDGLFEELREVLSS